MRTVELVLASALLCVLALGVNSCAKGVKPDLAMAAAEAGDYTVILEGCGSQPVVGYAYCRMREGDSTDQAVTIHVPPAQCKDAECVFWKVYFPSGASPALGGAVKKGQTTAVVSWKDLLKADKFQSGDRGFWPVAIEVHWTGSDGQEHSSIADGEIRLRVTARAYVSLLDVAEDPNFVWSWSDNMHVYRLTTGMRTYVGPVHP